MVAPIEKRAMDSLLTLAEYYTLDNDPKHETLETIQRRLGYYGYLLEKYLFTERYSAMKQKFSAEKAVLGYDGH